MSSNQQEGKRDLVLAPGEYAYLQDETRGMIKTFVGPTVINQTAQDRPVVYDSNTGRFMRVGLESAVQKSPLASEGDYIVLENPSEDNKTATEGGGSMPHLRFGRKVNIPGPCNFALWPSQKATVIKGHHLRSNQYLPVRIYNEEEAKKNWESAVAVRINKDDQTEVATSAESLNLTIGKLLIIKGTEVSFYIPPTGVEVIADSGGNYVREAVTLERLEYTILVDEDGNKRYECGPQVVFPKPTENFFVEGESRKFKAIDLNALQGLHIKVIAAYKEDEQENDVGDELFITGNQTPIYYPRVEHSIIRYGEQKKHYATAIPAGEGRYVMDRNSGNIRTEHGPKMLLPDPRKEVLVRRILSDKQVNLWYPTGSENALNYNRQLREVANTEKGGRSGYVTDTLLADYSASSSSVSTRNLAGADTFERGTSYTQPRTITLDTKYEGVPGISVWTGYAVMVVSKTGNRRVVVGPANILLSYDESLEVLELSTGKPKNTDKLEKTVYLRVANNKVGDIVRVKTKDQVDVDMKLSFRVNFEGESSKWFQVENYIKFLCDHCRSVLRGVAQKVKVEDLQFSGVEIIRDAILGPMAADKSRPGMVFKENGMVVADVEVLSIDVTDPEISKMLSKSQHDVVRSNIDLHLAEKQHEVFVKKQQLDRAKAEEELVTNKAKANAEASLISEKLKVNLSELSAELEALQKRKEVSESAQAVENINADNTLKRKKSSEDLAISLEKERQKIKEDTLVVETEATVRRFEAAQHGFSEALLQLQSQETLVKVTEALSVLKILGGKNVTDVLGKMFEGSPLESMLSKVTSKLADRKTVTLEK